MGLVFGALECFRLAPRDGSRNGLLAQGGASVALPWILGTGAAMLYSDPALPDLLHSTSRRAAARTRADTRAEMAAQEAAAGHLPSVDACRDAC